MVGYGFERRARIRLCGFLSRLDKRTIKSVYKKTSRELGEFVISYRFGRNVEVIHSKRRRILLRRERAIAHLTSSRVQNW